MAEVRGETEAAGSADRDLDEILADHGRASQLKADRAKQDLEDARAELILVSSSKVRDAAEKLYELLLDVETHSVYVLGTLNNGGVTATS